MNKDYNNSTSAFSRSKKREEQLIKKYSLNINSFTTTDLLKLISELELRNEKLGAHVNNLLLAEEAARKTINKFKMLYDFAPMGYFSLEQDGIIYEMNINGAKMLGNDRKKLLNNNFINYVTEDSIDIFNKFITSIYRTKKKEICELRLKAKKYPISIYMEGVLSEDDQRCLLAAVDVTTRRKAEDALKESEKRLKEINTSKDMFFSIISHDLRSPFSSIIGFSNLLVEKVRERDYKRIEEYAGIIHGSSWRVMNLLVNLIEWSSSQTGRLEFNPKFFDFADLINVTIELFNDSALAKAINISCDLPQSAIVFADKEMIGAILRNLISNAIKYTHQGGSVSISVNQSQEDLTLSVSDTGVGIPKEIIEKLFLIEESHSTRGTHKETGTGMGLLLCKEFAEKHGGKLLIESKQGKGSTFTFIFPVSN